MTNFTPLLPAERLWGTPTLGLYQPRALCAGTGVSGAEHSPQQWTTLGSLLFRATALPPMKGLFESEKFESEKFAARQPPTHALCRMRKPSAVTLRLLPVDVSMHSLSKWLGAAEASPEDEEEMLNRFTIDRNKKYGEGAYGATFAAQDTKTGHAAAVKVIDTRRVRLEAIRKECSILEGLVHSNVITLLGHGSGRKSSGQAHLYFIFME
eukprot:scaffold30780_cov51-Phaeocystis_antarctica.AAC.1